MTKTFVDKLREWTLYEDAHPGNLRGVIRQAAEEVDRLTVENERLRKVLELCIEDYHEPIHVEDSAVKMLLRIEEALNQ